MVNSAYLRAWLKRRARARRAGRMMAMFSAVTLLAAIGVGVWPFLQRDGSDRRLAAAAERATVAAQSFPAGSRNAMVERAVEYNRLLLKGGQSVFGGSVDPVSGESDDDFDGEKDPEYHELLKTDALGTMARIRVPKVNIDLPVYHGAGQNTLDMGAGHLYGSSLPVGGKGSHTVITAHTNSAEGMFFTRLDEIGKGDMFYIDVLGHTLAYRVRRIELVDPTGRTSDYATLAARKGVDEATLLTCSGSGNTKRLLVTGVRVPYSPSGEQRSAGHPEAAAYALPVAALTAMPGLAVAGVGELTASTNQMLAQKFARWDRVLAHPGCETMHVVWVTAGRDSNSDSVLMPALEQLAADRPRMHVAPYAQWRAHMTAMDGWAPQAGDPAPFESDWMHADMGRVAAMVGLPGGERWRIPARLDPPPLF